MCVPLNIFWLHSKTYHYMNLNRKSSALDACVVLCAVGNTNIIQKIINYKLNKYCVDL